MDAAVTSANLGLVSLIISFNFVFSASSFPVIKCGHFVWCTVSTTNPANRCNCIAAAL